MMKIYELLKYEACIAVLFACQCMAGLNFNQRIISSDPQTSYYGVGIGKAWGDVMGKELWVVSWNSPGSTGSLTAFWEPSGQWTNFVNNGSEVLGSVVRDSGSVPYYDVAVGNANGGYPLDGVYFVTQHSFKSIFPSWGVAHDMPLVPREVNATLEFGAVAIGNMDSTLTSDAPNQVVFASPSGYDSDGYYIGPRGHLLVYHSYANGGVSGYWSCKDSPYWVGTGDAFSLAIGEGVGNYSPNSNPFELVFGNRYAFSLSAFQNWWTDGIVAVYQHQEGRYGRGIAIGNFIPDTETNFVGKEIVVGTTLHSDWLSTSEPIATQLIVFNWQNYADTSTFHTYTNSELNYAATGQTRYIRRIAAGDLDDDGIDEFVIAAYGTSPMLAIYKYNVTTESFDVQVLDASRQYYDVKIADVDNNGRMDIIYAADGQAGVYFQKIPTDLNGDNSIDYKDFAIFAQHWLEGTQSY